MNIGNILLLVAFIALVYFMMIRPQKKKEKSDAEMRDNLKIGDEIMTIGGIIGRVTKITEKTIIITTGADKTKIELIKTAVASVSKADAAKNAPAKNSEKEESDNLEDKNPNKAKKVTPKKLSKKTEETAAE